MGFSFEDRCLRAIERFAADQIIDDLLGNQLPIDYDHVGDDIGDLSKREADWSSGQCDSRAVISLASASGARKAKSAAAVDGKIIPRCLSVVSELRKSASR